MKGIVILIAVIMIVFIILLLTVCIWQKRKQIVVGAGPHDQGDTNSSNNVRTRYMDWRDRQDISAKTGTNETVAQRDTRWFGL